jgi:hypothetical protein
MLDGYILKGRWLSVIKESEYRSSKGYVLWNVAVHKMNVSFWLGICHSSYHCKVPCESTFIAIDVGEHCGIEHSSCHSIVRVERTMTEFWVGIFFSCVKNRGNVESWVLYELTFLNDESWIPKDYNCRFFRSSVPFKSTICNVYLWKIFKDIVNLKYSSKVISDINVINEHRILQSLLKVHEIPKGFKCNVSEGKVIKW